MYFVFGIFKKIKISYLFLKNIKTKEIGLPDLIIKNMEKIGSGKEKKKRKTKLLVAISKFT